MKKIFSLMGFILCLATLRNFQNALVCGPNLTGACLLLFVEIGIGTIFVWSSIPMNFWD